MAPGKNKAPSKRLGSSRPVEAHPAWSSRPPSKGSHSLGERLKLVDWQDLELFLEVVEAGSVRAGAAATRHTVATIRRRIGRIEDKLGEAVAKRGPSGLKMTQVGTRLLSIAREMRRLRLSLEAEDEAEVGRERVRIAVTEGLGTYWLMPRLVEFQSDHPELDILLHCDMQRSDVAGGACDVAIQLEMPKDARTVVERLGALHLMPFASDRYLREAGMPKSIDEWPQHRLVWQEADQVASNLLPFVLGTSETRDLIALRTNSSSAHFRAIASGGGIGILPTYARAVSRRVRPLDIGVQLRREIFCVFNAERQACSGVQLVVAWLRKSFNGGAFPWFADDFVHPRDFEPVISSPNVISMFEGFIDTLDADDG
ncbi:LysR family transcriptional regulator [Sphingobium lactosutens]|nr:LysR family transcriptional regulator [Sphingobium lactosutens]